ncbi:MAG TPA: proline racemase family protein [Burkholderiales bacterium]|nr:proline racemase family protein [Burkholderiales bacterium]
MQKLKVIDSHTGGEPTRVIVDGGPDLGRGPLVERRSRLQKEFDRYRSAAVNEPRGSDVIVGALLVEPVDPAASAGVIFFNNVGTIGMCGHGSIGLMVTLAHMGRIEPGQHRIETPVGNVIATLEANGEVTVQNVPSWRSHKNIEIQVEEKTVRGDIAWGGNWFFLTQGELGSIESLTDRSWRIRQALNAQGHPDVDHVELFGPAKAAGASARSFVLCPGKAYDRSPCGTGTSAKLSCLAADGKLAEGAPWVQESIIGSTFSASYQWLDRAAGKVIPSIRGSAFITAESTLLLDERDPFCWGIR